MIAAFATLAFLVTGWISLYAVVMTSDDDGAKVVAALKGQSIASQPSVARPVTVRFSSRYPMPRSQMVRAKVEWRAAA